MIQFLIPAGGYSSPQVFNRYFIDAAREVKPSVVNIIIYTKKRRKGKYSYNKIADASGTIISSDGFIVTNHHVVLKGNYYQVISGNGSKFELEKFENGSFFLADPKTDIALLKIDNHEGERFKPIKFGNSNKLTEGEWVIAIGNPYGLKQSITSGIVSSKGRDDVGFVDIEDFIQSDVSINPGNSGGPLVNLYGEMVGINTAIRTVSGGYQGISFAIPSNITRQVCYELMRHGRVRRGWLGFIAKEKKVYKKGVKVNVVLSSVIKNSPAEIAGLQGGDIIREIDGLAITSLGSLIKTVGKKPVGAKINITISRDAKLYDFRLLLREKGTHKKIRKGIRTLFYLYGIEVDENSEADEIIISYLSPRSVMYGLKRGDIVVSLNGNTVSSLDDFVHKFFRSGKRIKKMKIYRDSRLFEVNFTK
ncbi:MAG: PDZ domain-containing protein [bacterium]|nr:PDZ domain-containing protein [bacterium]